MHATHFGLFTAKKEVKIITISLFCLFVYFILLLFYHYYGEIKVIKNNQIDIRGQDMKMITMTWNEKQTVQNVIINLVINSYYKF